MYLCDPVMELYMLRAMLIKVNSFKIKCLSTVMDVSLYYWNAHLNRDLDIPTIKKKFRVFM